jgi:hypothetical protein
VRARISIFAATRAVEIQIFCPRRSLEFGRIEARVRFGDGKAGLLLTADQWRQPALLLLGTAEDHDRIQPENVHVHGGGAREPSARLADRLHHQRGFGDAKPGAAMLGRHRDTEPAGVGNGTMKVVGETAVTIALEPIGGVEALAQLRDAVADRKLLGCEGEIHLIATQRRPLSPL